MPGSSLLRILTFGSTLWATGCLWIGAGEHRERRDLDGDGRTGDLDCDALDPTVFVGAVEMPCDGIDNDCDPATPDGASHVLGTVYDTVQQGIDAAEPGSVVEVCPGTWSERLVISDTLTLQGALGRAVPVIDATGLAGPVIELSAGATLRDLVLTGGTGAPSPDPVILAANTMGGGLMALLAADGVVLSGVRIEGNRAEVGGGVVGPIAGSMQLIDTVISNNTAERSGGGAVLFTADLQGVSIEGNAANDLGGGVWVVGASTVSSDLGTVVSGNTAQDGGGVYLAPDAAWTGGTVAGNMGLASGGGVQASERSSVSGTTIRDNSAARGGGVTTADEVDLTGVSVLGNLADSGGGVYATGVLRVWSSTVADNRATVDLGGGFRIEGAFLALQDTSVVDNEALGGGGGIAASASQVEIDAGDMTGNQATHGGAVYAALGADCVTGCVVDLRGGVALDDNTAVSDGGAVWSEVRVLGDSTTLSRNTADRGGAVFAFDGGLELSSCALADNTAREGGAVYVDLPTLTTAQTDTCDWLANSGSEGSALFVAAGDMRVEGGMVNGNQAAGGGAMHLEPGAAAPNVLRSVGVDWGDNTDSDLFLGQPWTALVNATFTCRYDDVSPGTCEPGVL